MTAWESYLSGFDGTRLIAVLAWHASRPPEIRALMERFPPGAQTTIAGRPVYVVSYAETDGEPGVFFSHYSPAQEYERAVVERFFVCGSHLTDGPFP